MLNDKQVFCVLDFETYSEAPLPQVGAFEYSAHQSTDIICAAWRTGTRDQLRKARTEWWAPGRDDGDFRGMLSALMDEDVIMVAHNALFEQVIVRNVLAKKHMYSKKYECLRDIPPSRWLCTASLARAISVPGSLEGAAETLGLTFQKDMEGNALIKKWCKPKRQKKGVELIERHADAGELQRLIDYCMADIAAEVELFLVAPPLSEVERDVWCLDQKINLRGFQVDRSLVSTTLKLIKEEVRRIDQATRKLTFGVVASARSPKMVKEWLEDNGTYISDMTKGTVDGTIANGLVEGDCLELLKHRQAVSKSSTAKYVQFDRRSRTDGRCRDILIYHTASTGRWGGSGIQPQNFPRGALITVKDGLEMGDLALEASGILAMGDLELVRMVYGDPMNVFSSCLRNMIVAPEGKILDVADYASIEVRVLWWMAGDTDGVQAFKDGRKIYEELAQDIFHQPNIKKITKDQRFLGKTATLGCGYQMGAEKFKASCAGYGVEVDEEVAAAAVQAYRTKHKAVVNFWKATETAAIAAVETPGKVFKAGMCSWLMSNGFLWCKLPSGRKIAYPKPVVKTEKNKWGWVSAKLYHWGLAPMSKKEPPGTKRYGGKSWILQSTYGGKLVENVVQATARDLMANAMLRLDAHGWDIVLSVHDELIAERTVGDGGAGLSNELFCQLMADVPAWASGCPVACEGWAGKRYKK